jgi:TonB family protein
MGREELRLILDHETEHLRAGDLRLLALATAFPILVPWSLPIWWMWSRLRLATEGDCDLRVLRRNPRSTRTYLELLLEVGRRLPQQGAVAAKLTQAEKSLEWRIRTMTMPMPRKPWLRGTLLLGSGALLIGVACAMPTPLAMEEEQELPAVHAVATRLHGDLSETARLAMEGPTFTPFTVRPEITNREAVARAMEAEYPTLLREAGIGGTASVWFFLDEAGAVQRVLLNTSSGHQALDQAAVRVARQIEFTPALEGDQRVPVWIALPITFTVR